MKLANLLTVATVAALALTGCSSTPNTQPKSATQSESAAQSKVAPAVLSLDGKYGDKDDGMIAEISGKTIIINWVDDDTTSLYWAGSVDNPIPGDTFDWTSKNDHEKTDSAMLASSDNTKKFKATKTEISFSASALGTTKTVHLKKH